MEQALWGIAGEVKTAFGNILHCPVVIVIAPVCKPWKVGKKPDLLRSLSFNACSIALRSVISWTKQIWLHADHLIN